MFGNFSWGSLNKTCVLFVLFGGEYFLGLALLGLLRIITFILKYLWPCNGRPCLGIVLICSRILKKFQGKTIPISVLWYNFGMQPVGAAC